MKQFKFLLNYSQIFENKQAEDTLQQKCNESEAMKDIVALGKEGKAGDKGKIYFINTYAAKTKINFGQTFTSRDCYIIANPDGTYTFETGERTSSELSTSEEQRKAGKGEWREQKKEEAKIDVALRIANISGMGQIEIPSDLIKQMGTWFKQKAAYFNISSIVDGVDTKTLPENFSNMSSQQMIEYYMGKSYASIISNASTDCKIQLDNLLSKGTSAIDNLKEGRVTKDFVSKLGFISLGNTPEAIAKKVAQSILLKKELYDFMEKYNQEHKAERGQLKTAGYTREEFPSVYTFDSLEDCLRFAWVYFIARKTIRKQDKSKTYEALYLGRGRKFWGQEKTFDVIKSEILTECKSLDNVVPYLQELYSQLGLYIEPIKGSFVSRKNTMEVQELRNLPPAVQKAIEKEIANDSKFESIGGFKISKVLAPATEEKGKTLLSAAAKTFTEGDVSSTLNKDMIFKLSSRSEFKLEEEKKFNIINRENVEVYFEVRSEEEALLKLLTPYNAPGEKEYNKEGYIYAAFKVLESVKLGGELESQKFFLDMINKFNAEFAAKKSEFISGSGDNFNIENLSNPTEKSFDLINSVLQDPNINPKKDAIKNNMDQNTELYKKINWEAGATGKRKRKTT